MSKPIELGHKPGDNLEIHRLSDIKDKTYYPSLYISNVDDPRLLDLPDEGECTIKYKVRSRTHREEKNPSKPKRSCSLDLDVISIAPTGGGSYKKKDSDDEYGKGARKAFKDYFDKK